MVRADMLQSFRGTIDEYGLRSLRIEENAIVRYEGEPTIREFWAVLDSDDLRTIRAAFLAGDRRAALSLVCERSQSIGAV